VDIRAVKFALTIAALLLAACGGPEPADTTVADEGPATPPSVRYDQYGAAGELAPPAEDLVNPFGGTASAVQQGEALFGTMNCDGCHGGGGFGFTGPSLNDDRWRYGGEDGALFHSIFYGRPNGMPAYGGLLSDETVWQLVTYIESLPEPDVVPTVAWR
jgi:cytochrome c oxidase cbb3-type subunit 3